MSVNLVSRGEAILQKIASTTGMTPSGKDFLIANLDPMHDNQLTSLQGWPDVESAPSVVRCIKQSVSLSTPLGAGNWDCHIVGWPWLNNLGGNTYVNRLNNVVAGTPSANIPYGGVAAYAVPSNTSIDYAFPNYTVAGQMSVAPVFTQGVTRVIGYGLEVVNTTSSLYKQGLVTLYRQSTPSPISWDVINATVANPNAFATYTSYRRPPNGSTEALLYPGSRQWAASEGGYVVAAAVGQDNPPENVSYCMPAIMFTDDLAASPNTDPIWLTGLGATSGTYFAEAVKTAKIHMPGLIFTGLSEQTTLQLNWNIYVESFPAVSESDILVLATPSCQYDPIALSMLSHTLNVLPVGVPANMNPSGEWFYDLVNGISQFAGDIGATLFGPSGRLIGNGVGNVAGIVRDRYLTAPGTTSISPMTVTKAARQQRAIMPAMRALQSATVLPVSGERKTKKSRNRRNRALVAGRQLQLQKVQ